MTRDQFTPALIDGSPSTLLGVDPAYSEIYDLDVTQGTQELTGDQAVLNTDAAEDYGVGVGDELDPGRARRPAGDGRGGRHHRAHPGRRLGQRAARRARPAWDSTAPTPRSASTSRTAPTGRRCSADLEEVVADVPIVSVQDKEEFADSIRAQINTLLYLIYGLLALAVVIAVIGIVNTLGLSVIERTREIGLLRAVGLSRSRLRRMVTLESVTIALMGAVLGMAVGLLIGVLLRQSLRDDLTALALPLPSLGLFLVMSVVFGVLAAVVPAVRASRMKVLDAIATE